MFLNLNYRIHRVFPAPQENRHSFSTSKFQGNDKLTILQGVKAIDPYNLCSVNL